MAAVTSAVIGAAAVANTAYQGKKGRDAAKDAARTQAAGAEAAAQSTLAAQNQFRSDLAPFRAAGETALPVLEQFATDPSAQVAALETNPLFQASLAARDRATLGSAATKGRIGTGDFSEQVAQNYMLAASPLLQQQEQSLLNLANIGQASAAQTGASGLRAAETAGRFGMGAADATSAGTVAAQQAGANTAAQVLTNLPSVIGAFDSAFAGPAPAISPLITQFPSGGISGVA